VDVGRVDVRSEEWVLALGNEGEGCRPELRSIARSAVSIPMPGGVESLNVGTAGAVLLYELTRTPLTRPGSEPNL
jgi:TrmH family RNA methyltransferase